MLPLNTYNYILFNLLTLFTSAVQFTSVLIIWSCGEQIC